MSESSQILWPQVEGRALLDLTDQIDRDSAVQIGAGAFGDVYKCRNTTGSPSLVAVKTARYFAENPENQSKLEQITKDLRRELGVWQMLKHPNVVPLIGVTQNFGPLPAAVLHWMPNGTLHYFLKNKTLTTDDRLNLVQGIASGIEYLHSKFIFHGDLHSGNVLIDEDQNPRISDFGLACTIGILQPGLSYLQRLSSTSNVGAVRWTAPERLSGSKPHTSGDIYSFGCVMFEVLSGDIPWKEKTNFQVVVLKLEAHKPPERPILTAVGDEHWALMVRCWSSPQQRPAAREVVVALQTFLSADSNDNGGPGQGLFTSDLATFLSLFPRPEILQSQYSLFVPSSNSTSQLEDIGIPGRHILNTFAPDFSHLIAQQENATAARPDWLSLFGFCSPTLPPASFYSALSHPLYDHVPLSDSGILVFSSTPDASFFWPPHEQGFGQSSDSLALPSPPVDSISLFGSSANRQKKSPFTTRREPVASKAMLEANARRRRRPATFKCDHCDQTFTALFSLKRHMQSHTVTVLGSV